MEFERREWEKPHNSPENIIKLSRWAINNSLSAGIWCWICRLCRWTRCRVVFVMVVFQQRETDFLQHPSINHPTHPTHPTQPVSNLSILLSQSISQSISINEMNGCQLMKQTKRAASLWKSFSEGVWAFRCNDCELQNTKPTILRSRHSFIFFNPPLSSWVNTHSFYCPTTVYYQALSH